MIDRRKKLKRENLFYISFSDMMSLLMAFFVLLFSMSTLDSVKFTRLSGSFETMFSEEQKDKVVAEYEQEEMILKRILSDLSAYIHKEKLQDDVAVKMENHAIVMDLGSKLLFRVGDATLKPEAHSVLAAFFRYFRRISNANLVVEGHTDDLPMSSPQFSTNWELSASRAASVVHFLAENGIPEKNCYIIGYNQFRPLVPNTSEENRAKNRRVRIIFKPVVKAKEASEYSAIMNVDKNTEILEATKNVAGGQ